MDANQLKRLAIAALLGVCCVAQSPTPAPSSGLDNWAGVGSLYNSAYSPHYSGFAALALPVSSAAQAYSFTLYQAVPVAGKTPTISTTTGVATILRTIKIQSSTLFLVGLATAGVATSSTATTGAFAGGGGAFLRFATGFTCELVAIQNKAASSASPELLGGLGYTWGK
jgi:hypothetical protein